MSIQTRATTGPSRIQPNYRVLAGVQVPGRRTRRTAAQMEEARVTDEANRQKAVEVRGDVIRRIAELEDQIDSVESDVSYTRTHLQFFA